MKRYRILVAAFLLGGVVAGCSSSDDPVVVTPPPPPPPPATTDFTGFVKDQFAGTSDTSDPVAVDDENFEFADDENPDAFADLLQ